MGDDNQVKVDYNPFGGGSPEDATHSADVAAMQTAVACGSAETGFVQYNGGFTWQRPTCATIQAFDQKGRLLGSMSVPVREEVLLEAHYPRHAQPRPQAITAAYPAIWDRSRYASGVLLAGLKSLH